MSEAAGLSALGVLIVDDEQEIVDLLTLYLGQQGYRVRGATTATAGLAALRDDPGLGVLVTDLRLPDLPGPAMAEELLRDRADAQAVEMVLITGAGDGDPVLERFRAQAFAVLRKPFRPSAVAAAVAGARAAAAKRRGGVAAAQPGADARSRLRSAVRALEAEAEMLAAAPLPPAEAQCRAGRIRDAARALRALVDEAVPAGGG